MTVLDGKLDYWLDSGCNWERLKGQDGMKWVTSLIYRGSIIRSKKFGEGWYEREENVRTQ